MEILKLIKMKEKGQSLIEVLVALSIVALIILGLVKASTVSINNSDFSQNQTVAVGLAQKKVSEIISLKNSDPVGFFTSLPTFSDEMDASNQFCLKSSLSDITSEILPSPPSGSKMAKVLVTVYWEENGTGTNCLGKKYLHNFQAETNVTNQ